MVRVDEFNCKRDVWANGIFTIIANMKVQPTIYVWEVGIYPNNAFIHYYIYTHT